MLALLKDFSKAVHSRWACAAALAAMTAGALYAFGHSEYLVLTADTGIALPSPDLWVANRTLGLWLNLAGVFAVVMLMVWINRAYNVPRTITMVYATLFAAMQTATPDVLTQMCSSTILALVVTGSVGLMAGTFGRRTAQRNVFLVFFLLSAATAVQYAAAVYVPVMLVGCAQMRIFSLRTALAALLGLAAPWWIAIGGGFIEPGQLHMPAIVSVFKSSGGADVAIAALTAALTAVAALTAYGMSLLKLMTYNAQMRAANGLLTMVTFATIAAMVVDFNNFMAYTALLNVCAAFMLGHVFVIRHNPQTSWIALLVVSVSYYSLYIWRIFA